MNQYQPVLWRSNTVRHLQGHPITRTLCGASIAWTNIPTNPTLATCPTCLARAEGTHNDQPT